jgi:hypothetical protein
MMDNDGIEGSLTWFQLQTELLLDGGNQSRKVIGAGFLSRRCVLNDELQREVVGRGEAGFIENRPVGISAELMVDQFLHSHVGSYNAHPNLPMPKAWKLNFASVGLSFSFGPPLFTTRL